MFPPHVDTLAGATARDGVKIRADMLPPSTHGSNIRDLVTKGEWKRLRDSTCEAAGNRCEICGAASDGTGRRARYLECHEKWIFERADGDRYVQRLERLIALCKDCHFVQHSGRAHVIGLEDKVIAHLRRLNRWTEQQALADFRRAVDRCVRLDQYPWDLDLSALQGMLSLDGYPELYVPARARILLGKSGRGG